MKTISHLILLCMVLLPSAFSRTFYIDFVGGSDSNDGTSKSAPWKRSPGMVGCANTCASTTPQPGDQFLFKGGVTWDSTALPLTVSRSGSSTGGPILLGVDQNWFSGAYWTRPRFDAGYAKSDAILVESSSYINIDNLELAHVSSSSNYGYGLISGASPSFLNITNCYLHGWRTSNSKDDAHGGVIFTAYNSNVHTIVIDNMEIENTENSSAWNGVMFRFVGTIKNSRLHDNSSAVLFALDFDHNELYNICYPNEGFDTTYHYNGVYLDAKTLNKTIGYIRNSTFHDVYYGANMSYLNGRFATIYNYNNVYYGRISAQRAIEIEPYDYGSNTTSGTYYIFNNTGILENGTPLVHVVNRSAVPQPSSIVIRNNHIIGTSVSVDDNGPAASYTRSNNLIQTATQATLQGYTVGSQGKSMLSTGSTVDAGFNLITYLTTDKNGNRRPQGLAWDIGAYEFTTESTSLSPPANLSALIN